MAPPHEPGLTRFPAISLPRIALADNVGDNVGDTPQPGAPGGVPELPPVHQTRPSRSNNSPRLVAFRGLEHHNFRELPEYLFRSQASVLGATLVPHHGP